MNIAIPEILTQRAADLKHYYEAHYPSLASLAEPCFLNTIQTTVKQLEDGSYFVITGDIPAMWLRDSAAQVKPYVLNKQRVFVLTPMPTPLTNLPAVLAQRTTRC